MATASSIALGVAFAILILCKNQFYRKTRLSSLLLSENMTEWVLYPVISLLGIGVITFYFNGIKSQKWWAFAFDSDTPIFLRGTIGAFSVLTFFSLWRLLSPVTRPSLASDAKAESKENLQRL